MDAATSSLHILGPVTAPIYNMGEVWTTRTFSLCPCTFPSGEPRIRSFFLRRGSGHAEELQLSGSLGPSRVLLQVRWDFLETISRAPDTNSKRCGLWSKGLDLNPSCPSD